MNPDRLKKDGGKVGHRHLTGRRDD